MKSWIIGLLFVCMIVAGGIILSIEFAGDNRAPDLQRIQNPQTNTEPLDLPPNTIYSLTTAPLGHEKVSVSALTCTIIDSGDYVVDLRLKNQDIETRTIKIYPTGIKMDILPNKTYRYDLHLSKEISILNILVDDGTELQVQSPQCIAAGWSGSSSMGSGSLRSDASGQANQEVYPPPPVPELSPLVLTLAGISVLMLLSRAGRK